MGLKGLVEISRRYGKNPEFVLAGGGNTSFKDEDHLYIKASGFPLGDIDEQGFAKMDRRKLDAVWGKKYSDDADEREKQALEDLMNARVSGETKRPSVETLLHALFPHAYVVHLHPPMVNGLTCAARGKKCAEELFKHKHVWVPVVNPGYVLALAVKSAIDEHMERGNDFPPVVLMQNHGIFVSGNTTEEIDSIYDWVMGAIEGQIERRPDFSEAEYDKKQAARLAEVLPEMTGALHCRFETNAEIARLVKNRESFYPLSSSYTPDHIVYYGHKPLFVSRPADRGGIEQAVKEGLADYEAREGLLPKIIAVRELGVFACGKNVRSADTALTLFRDAVKVSVYTEAFGGPLFMPKDKIDFIVNWEVEQYRSKIHEEG